MDLERFGGSEQAKGCEFCAVLEGVDEERIPIMGTESATAIISKKDGHPLIMPLLHVEGLERDPISRSAIRSADELADELFPYIEKAYREIYGATGFTKMANLGSQQNIPHYHVHWDAYTGSKKEGTSTQIVIPKFEERWTFADAIRRNLDPQGLAVPTPGPTHW